MVWCRWYFPRGSTLRPQSVILSHPVGFADFHGATDSPAGRRPPATLHPSLSSLVVSGLCPMTERPQLPAPEKRPKRDKELAGDWRTGVVTTNHPTAKRSPPPWKGGERELTGWVVFPRPTPKTKSSPSSLRRGGPKRSDWWGGESKIVTPTEDRLPPTTPTHRPFTLYPSPFTFFPSWHRAFAR